MEPFSNFSSTSWGTSLGRSPEVGLMLGFGHTQLQAPWTSSHSCYISFKSTGRPAEGCMGSWHMVVQSLCRWIQNYPVCGCLLGASCSSSGDEICITAHLFFLLFIFNLSWVILRNQKIYWKYMHQLISWMYCVYFNEAQEVFRKYFFLNIFYIPLSLFFITLAIYVFKNS